MGNRINEVRKERKISLDLLAERTGLSTSYLSRLQNSQRNVSLKHLATIANALGVDQADLIDGEPREVPLVGYVGASPQGAALFASGQGPFDMVDAPDGATPNTVAVEVRGTSLGSLFDSWLVFYDDLRDPPDLSLARKLCIVGLIDGETVLVKKLIKGSKPGFWTLLSNTEEPIYDVELAWAARVKAMMPR